MVDLNENHNVKALVVALTGATGAMGGEVLAHLLESKDVSRIVLWSGIRKRAALFSRDL